MTEETRPQGWKGDLLFTVTSLASTLFPANVFIKILLTMSGENVILQ